MKKLVISSAVLVALLLATFTFALTGVQKEQPAAQAAAPVLFGKSVLAVAAAGCESGTFACYCNGSYVGCVTTIQYCWNACGSTEQIQ